MHQLEAVIEQHQPDVIGLQETKVRDEEFPEEAVREMGYHSIFHGQKTHYGVALLTKQAPVWAEKGFEGDAEDEQRRLVGCGIEDSVSGETIAIFNGYFPQGEGRDHPKKFPAKERFYQSLTQRITQINPGQQPVIVMGDMNVAPQALDIGIGEDNAKRWLRTGKCSFLPEERAWLEALMSDHLKDSYRELYPEASEYSWFDYRSRGFEREPKRGLRIDLILATTPLLARAVGAGIDYDVRGMDKPSDHCPVWFEIT